MLVIFTKMIQYCYSDYNAQTADEAWDNLHSILSKTE